MHHQSTRSRTAFIENTTGRWTSLEAISLQVHWPHQFAEVKQVLSESSRPGAAAPGKKPGQKS